ncbi:cholera enterotoxin subunit B [Vibrio vulnificus]
MNKKISYIFLCLGLYSGYALSDDHNIDEICGVGSHSNRNLHNINQRIVNYTESIEGKNEVIIIRFPSGAVFQVETTNNSNYISSQEPAVKRLRDTLRVAFLTGTKIEKICSWTTKSPNAIAAISFNNE